ncbi:PAAR domain-containing protein [Polyangium sorediatum]|uniref:PAAR domain-containing protein n=1 Tax=Polyangium sorediatum TaxID=889274 RepID=A0ABT6NYS1_9BACT|nr:PAAR domain-containing protein [Polyangium sorediatum]MDI1433205.1 PAAR domain-containing protein [Polyangium sorediatum]
MKPAARLGDLHVCPKDDPKVHVGGPIIGPGCPTVLLGGSPAARGSSGVVVTPDMFDVPEDKAQLIKDNAEHILNAANEFAVDPRTLAAIILRENLDNNALKEFGENFLGFYHEDWGPIGKPSIGLAQVQIATARFLEEQGYITPTSSDEVEFFGMNFHTTNMAREKRLEVNSINTLYAAAYMRYFINEWSTEFPLVAARPDILGTLYNLGHEKTSPHGNPQVNDFGEDVLRLYPLMASLLGGCGDGDVAKCEPALDQLEQASATVFWGGLPAARMGDETCHGGVISTGFPTVLIGD